MQKFKENQRAEFYTEKIYGKGSRTLYQTLVKTRSRSSTVNCFPSRKSTKPILEKYITVLLAASSSTFPTAKSHEEAYIERSRGEVRENPWNSKRNKKWNQNQTKLG